MHPQVQLFLRLTLLIAVLLGGFVLMTFITGLLIKVVLVAALVAGAVMGGLFLYNAIMRRRRLPLSTPK